jgi:hypothetical protein
MTNLVSCIESLADEDAILAIAYIADWLRNEGLNGHKLPEEVLDKAKNEKDAVNLLSETFPDQSDTIHRSLLNTELSQRGQIARNLLITLSEKEEYASMIETILEREKQNFEPIIMTAASAAAIVYFLSIEYHIKFKDGKWEVEISYRKPSEDILKKILGLIPFTFK